MIYQAGKFLRVFYDGVGNINYEIPPPNTSALLNAANDGLTIDAGAPTTARLGQPLNQAGDPAKLLQDREVPLNNHFFNFRNVFPRDNVSIGAGELSLFNDEVLGGMPLLEIFDTHDGLLIFLDGVQFNFDFSNGGGTDLLTMVYASHQLDWNQYFSVRGFGAQIQKLTGSGVFTNYLFTYTDHTLLIDASASAGGDFTVRINPAMVASNSFMGNVKKVDASVNTVTLLPTSGTIQGIGAPAANYVFNVQGQSVAFQSDGTNIYIL